MPDIQPQRELPLRGVAMILISVALLLAMWGIYSMTGGKSAKVHNAASTDSAAASVAPAQPAAPAGPVTSAPGVPAPSSGAPAPAPAPAGAVASGAAAPGAPSGATAGTAGAAGASTSAGDKSAVTVHVLNNSTIQGLAAKAKEQLTRQGYRSGRWGSIHARSCHRTRFITLIKSNKPASLPRRSVGLRSSVRRIYRRRQLDRVPLLWF